MCFPRKTKLVTYVEGLIDRQISQSSLMNVNHIVDQLRMMEHVHHVSVNSTLCRHMNLTAKDNNQQDCVVEQDYHIITRSSKKKALIVCFTIDRLDWETQYHSSIILLKEKLGFEVCWSIRNNTYSCSKPFSVIVNCIITIFFHESIGM